MLIITGYIHVDPADLAKFMTELNALASTTRKRPGSITYDAAVDDPHSGRLLISERWVGRCAYHLGSRHDRVCQPLER
ncbi:putative quinol monooxygenase [Agrobacterium salinitolerans]|uniref:putative quinol monooxygenase n=1 Tax=Agrobacterium salinitolerans TaxID=1183413 RepID=UPI0020B23FCF|nr:antibiotic biosynthesis monooxygenase [Agrobacterium salinitolerans]